MNDIDQHSKQNYQGASAEALDWELCRLLIDCLKRDESDFDTACLSGLSPERWQSLLTLATDQRIMPLLWHRLKQKGLDDAVPIETAEALRKVSHRNTMRNLRLYGDLRILLSALKPEGIPLILLKGIFLADSVYDNIGLREMNDIDVLAHPADLKRIADIVMGMSYTPLRPFFVDSTLNAQHHLPPMIKKGHAKLEIHWNLTVPNKSYSIDPGGLWERALPVQINGCRALTLAPEDLLLHLCMHTSYQHQFAFGLRPSCDIAEILAHFGSDFDWQTTATRADAWGWQRGVYLALRLAKEMAGADVPVDILKRLRPADMTEAIIETARTQVFTDKIFANTINAPLAELLGNRRLWGKIRIFWQRVFLPRAIIAVQYSLSMNSIRIYSCYPRRFIDVLRRHSHTLKNFGQTDAPLKALVGRKNLIADWLSGPATHSRK